MPKKKVADTDEMVLEVLDDLANAEPDNDSPYLTAKDLGLAGEEGGGGGRPGMEDPGWSEYVRSLFTDQETDDEGNPYVHGLRRVARKLLGRFMESSAKVVQCPNLIPGTTSFQPAVVQYTVVIETAYGPEAHTDAASVFYFEMNGLVFGNTDPQYARFAVETAATRAEARALRKALLLTKVIAAEERTLVPLEESGANGLLTSAQKNLLNVMTGRLKIDLLKFINSGGSRYGSVDEMPASNAFKAIEFLHQYQSNPSSIPNNLKRVN